jgi:hypothetical protein
MIKPDNQAITNNQERMIKKNGFSVLPFGIIAD